MESLTRLWLRIKALFLRRRLDSDLHEELRFHLEMRESSTAESLSGPEVQRAHAHQRFGNAARIMESCRELWTFGLIEEFLQDLRLGTRMLRKNAGLTAVTVLTLALGIGASSCVFNMLRQWVIEAVSFPQPNRLTVVWEKDTKRGSTFPASAPDFLDWRLQNRVFEDLSAWSLTQFNLSGQDNPVRISGARVSADFFRTLKVPIAQGRDFRSTEEQPGAEHVAIISSGLWHERFNSNPDLLGQTIRLDGRPYTVVGIAPADFHFTVMGRANIWVPLAFSQAELGDRETAWLNVIGRLRPGVSFQTAQANMSGIASRLEKTYPQTNTDSGVLLTTLSKEIGQHVGDQAVYTAFVVGVCILLIACFNIAGIYLARSFSRRKEISMRLALGARRGRIARQLLAENTALVPLAVVLGVYLARFGGNWITAAIPYENRGWMPNFGRLYVDPATVVFAVAVTMGSVLLFTLAPMLETRKTSVTEVLKEFSGTSSGSGMGRMRKLLIIGELALALAVLVPAGLATKSFSKRLQQDPGFNSDHLLTAEMSLPETSYGSDQKIAAFYSNLSARLQNIPQVTGAAVSDCIPFGNKEVSEEFWIDGRPNPQPGHVPGAIVTSASSTYQGAMQLRLLKGRFISSGDTAGAPPVIVVNDTLVNRLFENENPIGHKLRLGSNSATWRTVVGVVETTKTYTLHDPPRPEVYVPFDQQPARAVSLVLRTAGDPLEAASALRNSVLALDPDLPVSNVETMAQRISDQGAGFRIFGEFCFYFALLALFLAAIGIYGVMAFMIERRIREIGIRMACGAERTNIFWLVLGGSSKLIAVGLLVGLAAGWGVSRILSSILFGISPNDPMTYVAAIGVLVITVLFASIAPVRRATQVDPMIVLRCE